jgi:hypothetical protein
LLAMAHHPHIVGAEVLELPPFSGPGAPRSGFQPPVLVAGC